MRKPMLVAGLLLLLFVACAVRGQDAENEREKIRAGWEALTKVDGRRQSYEVSRREIDLEPKENRKELRLRSEIRIDEGQKYLLFKIYPNKEKGETLRLYALNPHYSFIVSQEEGKEWRLLKVVKGGDMGDAVLNFGSLPMIYPLSSSCWGTPLADLIADKNFVIQPLEAAPGGKVKLRFRFRQFFMQRKWLPFSGHAILDPARHYVAEKWEYVMDEESPKRPCTYSSEFESEGDHLRCLSNRLVDPFRDRTFTFEKYDTGPIDHAPFRLAYYNLPEPVGVPPPPSRFPRSGWLLLAGAGLLALGVAGRWYWGRKAARAVS